MTELSHDTLSRHLVESGNSVFAPVFLVHGETYLCEQAAGAIVNAILPDAAAHRLHHEIHHAQDGNLGEVVEHLNTFSFFSGRSVIELRHPLLFESRFDPGKLLQRIQKAHETSDASLARQRYLELLSRLRIDPEEISAENLSDKLGIDPSAIGDPAWLLAINEDCVRNHLAAPEYSADIEIMQRVVEKGFPKNKHLLIVTDTTDKRSGLYRAVRKNGVIVDCSVPKGVRKADRDEQRRIFRRQAAILLEKCGKTIDNEAFDAIVDMTGFDLRLFTANLDKLIDYASDRRRITASDVRSVLDPLRDDPIYELTGAVADRDVTKALAVLSALLGSGTHELQIIMAITNQIRRLLLIRSFLENGLAGPARRQRVSYDQFQRDILPAARQYDDRLAAKLASFSASDSPRENRGALTEEESGPSDKTAVTLPDDVSVFRKKEHPYAAYSLYLKAGKFDARELQSAFSALNQADVALKTSGGTSAAILENLIIGICGIGR